MANEQLSIDDITINLVEAMLHLIGVTLAGQEPCFSEDTMLHQNLRQFEAINQQIEMLLCTRPESPWARYCWLQNFNSFFIQAARQSRYCLAKIAPQFRGCSIGLIQELFTLIYQGNHYLNKLAS